MGVVYFIIGLIVSAIETVMVYRDMKNMGLSLKDICPTISSLNNVWIVFGMVCTFIVLAVIWPAQVSYWIYRIYRSVFHKKV